MDDGLLIALKAHNPWLERPTAQATLLADSLPSPFLNRVEQLQPSQGRADLVVGPRQAGKTTWIRQTLSRRSNPILILHAEEPRIRELCRSPAEALGSIGSLLADETVVFLEEIQHLDDAPLFVKGLVDLQPSRRIVATGSSSFQFSARTRESLAGRARRTLLLPFSFEEVAAQVDEGLAPPLRQEALGRLWSRLVLHGGYPSPWFVDDPEAELFHLTEAFVLKDASDLHTIERPDAFRKLLELAAADVGNLVNVSTWAAHARVSRDTVNRYLEIASDAHILRLVQPFHGGKRAEVTGSPKVFFIDNGLRNALFGGFGPLDRRPDLGALWENLVFAELLKRTDLLDQIFFWRTRNGAEVDFVLRRKQRLIGLEVKATPLVRPKLPRAARSFIQAYQPDHFGVINANLSFDDSVDGVPVLYRRPWELGELL